MCLWVNIAIGNRAYSAGSSVGRKDKAGIAGLTLDLRGTNGHMCLAVLYVELVAEAVDEDIA